MKTPYSLLSPANLILIFLAMVSIFVTGCQTKEIAKLPDRPAALPAVVSFDAAIDFAVDDVLIQAQRLPEFRAPPAASGIGAVFSKEQPPPPKILIAVDKALDAATGQQTAATLFLDSRLLERATARFPSFRVKPLSGGQGDAVRFTLTASLTALDMRQGNLASYRVSLALVDSRSGIVVAQAGARAAGDAVDMTPTPFYRDSPSMTKDRIVEGQIRTAQTPVGSAADEVYLSSLTVLSMITEGSRLYDAGQYAEALAVYETAAARADGKQLRVFNGLYLSNTQLGKTEAAEQAFGNIVRLGLATNSLSVKFLFKPGGIDFWTDPKVSGPYPMWLRALGRDIAASKVCLTIAGHTSRTGAEAFNERLSLLRAASMQKRIESVSAEVIGRIQSIGVGFRENLIGTGTDDARDALDRRVDFRVRGC
jgi:outer membrane protein OmpA-like peptidoglycan-associated protein